MTGLFGRQEGLPRRGEEVPRDSLDLAHFGYSQQLSRTMGSFSSFAVSFSLISVTTGIFAGFGAGIRQAGPSVVWTWLIVMAGQFLVALVLAELAAHFPLSGYGYQWSSRLIGPKFGYFVGWLLLLQFVTGFPGVCKAFGDYFHEFLGLASAYEGRWRWLTPPRLTVLVIASVALIHLYGIRLVSWINDVGVLAEVIGTVLITAVLLAFFAFRQPDAFAFLRVRIDATGNPAGLMGFASALLLGAWCLTGFEAAADLAEETRNPRAIVPRAVILSEVTAGVVGFFMLAAFLLTMDRGAESSTAQSSLGLAAIQKSDAPLLNLIQGRLGAAAGGLAMLVVFVSVFACGIASLATATRLVFSMARDNMLPASTLLRKVHPDHKTPQNAILLVAIGASILVLAIEKLELITGISTVAGYLGYSGILVAAWVGLKEKSIDGVYSLGVWRTPVTLAAILWSLTVVAAVAVTALLRGELLPLAATAIALVLGGILYGVTVRGRLQRGTAGPPNASASL